MHQVIPMDLARCSREPSSIVLIWGTACERERPARIPETIKFDQRLQGNFFGNCLVREVKNYTTIPKRFHMKGRQPSIIPALATHPAKRRRSLLYVRGPT